MTLSQEEFGKLQGIEKELESIKNVTKTITEEEITKAVSMGDIITHEISTIAFGVNANYDWHILELIDEADKLAYSVLDRLAVSDQNLRLAFRKLRPRIAQAVKQSKTAASKITKAQAETAQKIFEEAKKNVDEKDKVI